MLRFQSGIRCVVSESFSNVIHGRRSLIYQRRQIHFCLRLLMLTVTLAAMFLGGWVARDNGVGDWWKSYRDEKRVVVPSRNMNLLRC